jgi:hypothetical protein
VSAPAIGWLLALGLLAQTAEGTNPPATAPASRDDPHVVVIPATSTLTQGESATTVVRIEITGPGPKVAAPPRLLATLGQVDEPQRTGDRTFAAQYHAPAFEFPQVAIIAAEQAEPTARGFATVALRAHARPVFRTQPGARVTARVGGEEFGPVTADASGQAQIPLVVPPGVATAHVRASTRTGHVTERDIDLKPPRFPLLLLLAPAALPAGAVVELGVVGIAADGSPIDDKRLVMRSSYLRPHPLGARDHVARYLVRVPPRIDAGPLHIVVRLRGIDGAGRAGEEPEDLDLLELDLPLRAGPLATLTLAPQQARLTVSGHDLWGHPVPVEGAEVYVNGQPARLDHQGVSPAVVLDVTHPLPAGPVEVEAVLDGVYTRYQLGPRALDAPEAHPTRATVRVSAVPIPRESISITAAVGLLWAIGPGSGVEGRVDLDVPSSYFPRGLRAGVGLGYLGTRANANDDIGQSHVALDQLLTLLRLRYQWQLGARLEVSLAGGAGMAYTDARNEVDRLRLGDRQLGSAAEIAAEAAGPAGPGALALCWRYLRVPVGRLPSGDVIEGGGGLVFDVGYRLRF